MSALSYCVPLADTAADSSCFDGQQTPRILSSRRLHVPVGVTAKIWRLSAPNECAIRDRSQLRRRISFSPVRSIRLRECSSTSVRSRSARRTAAARFDHKFLNEDNPCSVKVPPTVESIARQLTIDVAPLFSDVATLVACHLAESPERSATFYSDGACEANYWFEFSAARRTVSPQLSEEENARLFGRQLQFMDTIIASVSRTPLPESVRRKVAFSWSRCNPWLVCVR